MKSRYIEHNGNNKTRKNKSQCQNQAAADVIRNSSRTTVNTPIANNTTTLLRVAISISRFLF